MRAPTPARRPGSPHRAGGASSGCLTIAQVTPFAWESENEINHAVRRVSDALFQRGHRALILAPSQSRELVRDSRRALQDPQTLLERAQAGPVVLGVGEVLGLASSRRRASLPVDVSRTIETAFSELPLDVVHVHEPFAPSAASVALRHSRALNVGSFHQPTERLLTAQLTRPLSRHVFGRLDARVASYRATRNLIQTFFPGDYQVILPAADVAERTPRRGPVRLLACAEEDRSGLRMFLRALRLLPDDLDWQVAVWGRDPWRPPATLSRALRERVRGLDSRVTTEAEALAGSDVLVMASEGVRPAPGTLVAGLAAGAFPVASRLPVYEELLGQGDYGLQFEPGDVQTLAVHLERVIASGPQPPSPDELRQRFSWSRLADELESLYVSLTDRRHAPPANGRIRSRLAQRRLIDVDLHMHTDHSYDCATPVEVLLAEARARGLGAIAVTDHNEISGAREARDKADGIKVIVAEEVKTADQGEVIGLFIEEKIERGMTLQETIVEIKRQGGLVYVPHPFDRLHSVPGYEHLLDVLDHIDAIEVFNPRIAISEFNDEAVRFAAKYRIPAGAGSDAHVPQGLGSVRIRMHDFEGPDEFLESLRDADILRNPASLLYVQALKFLQTKALPAPARRAARDRRVRRATGHDERGASPRRRRKS
ncbi:MAG TPA: PHP-associated domain-containing protein [Solirubrobacteraceae bacterium]|nr:PHP-associated domain-containing protein [Solirubrobacteraceae bacterium]